MSEENDAVIPLGPNVKKGKIEGKGVTVTFEKEGPTEREQELEQQLQDLANQDFEKNRKELADRLRESGKDQLAAMAEIIENAEQLQKLKDVVEDEQEQKYEAPAGRASLVVKPNQSNWKTKNYESSKAMIDDLYDRLEDKNISPSERAEIDKTLSDMFKKMKTTPNMEIKGE